MEYTGVSVFGPERKKKEEETPGDAVGALPDRDVSYDIVIFI